MNVEFRKDFVFEHRLKGKYLVIVEYPNLVYFADRNKQYMFPLFDPAAGKKTKCFISCDGFLVAYAGFDPAKIKVMEVSQDNQDFALERAVGFDSQDRNDRFTYVLPFKLS